MGNAVRSLLKPNRRKAVYLAKKQLPELVCDAVNLEGVNFTLAEVQTLLDGVTVGGYKLQDEMIVLNQANAWRFLFDSVEQGQFDLSARFVCEMHGVLAEKEALTWGAFREGGVTIAGTDYIPPSADGLASLWHGLAEKTERVLRVSEVNSDRIYGSAISLFLQMARIQFFYDANKRLGRLVMNGILLMNGLAAINLPAKKKLQFDQLMLDFYASSIEQSMHGFMRDCLHPKHVEIMSE